MLLGAVLRTPAASRPVRLPSVPPLIPHLFPSLPISPPLTLRPKPARPPCVPFFRDPKHIVPTKRLYRSLLRATYRFPITVIDGQIAPASSGDGRGLAGIRLRAIRDWHKRRQNTSPTQTAAFLSTQSTLLFTILNTPPESPSYPALLSRDFALHLSHTRRLARLAFSRAQRTVANARPSHLTGGFLRPTASNPPLPRLRPQPERLSMMIHARVRAHERRIASRRVWEEYAKDMAAEVALWKGLGLQEGRKPGEAWEGSQWALGMREMLKRCDAGWEGEIRRKGMAFKEGMRRRVGRARARREGWWRDRAEARRVEANKEKVGE